MQKENVYKLLKGASFVRGTMSRLAPMPLRWIKAGVANK